MHSINVKGLISPLKRAGQLLIFAAVFSGLIAISVKVVEEVDQRRMANNALQWMEKQSYPDNCGYQGEFPHPLPGLPCKTLNGYRFVSHSYLDRYRPFERVVRVHPDGKWTMRDVIVSWTRDGLSDTMVLSTGSTDDLRALMRAIPDMDRK